MAEVAEFVSDIAFYLYLPCKPLTANDHVHWRARSWNTHKIRDAAKLQALSHRNQMRLPAASTPQRLHLILIHAKGSRTLDTDQVYAALKPVVDGLRDAQLILDDSPTWLYYTASQEKGTDSAIRVRVYLSERI